MNHVLLQKVMSGPHATVLPEQPKHYQTHPRNARAQVMQQDWLVACMLENVEEEHVGCVYGRTCWSRAWLFGKAAGSRSSARSSAQVGQSAEDTTEPDGTTEVEFVVCFPPHHSSSNSPVIVIVIAVQATVSAAAGICLQAKFAIY